MSLNPIRPDWRDNDRIFRLIVLRILWAIYWRVTHAPGKADKTIGTALLDSVDWIEANNDNPSATQS